MKALIAIVISLYASISAYASKTCDASSFAGSWEITSAVEPDYGKPWRDHLIGNLFLVEKRQNVWDQQNRPSKNGIGITEYGASGYTRFYAVSPAKDRKELPGWQNCQIYNPESGYSGYVLIKNDGRELRMENWLQARLVLRKVDATSGAPNQLISTLHEVNGTQWGLPRGLKLDGISTTTNRDFTDSLAKLCADKGGRLPNIDDVHRVMTLFGASNLKGREFYNSEVKAVADSPNVLALYTIGGDSERKISSELFLGKFAHNLNYYYSAFALSEEGVVAKTLHVTETLTGGYINSIPLLVVYRMPAKDGPRNDSPVIADNDPSLYLRSAVAESMMQPCIVVP